MPNFALDVNSGKIEQQISRSFPDSRHLRSFRPRRLYGAKPAELFLRPL
jgi:hypothetical protein